MAAEFAEAAQQMVISKMGLSKQQAELPPDDDMGHTVLGDYQHTIHQHYQAPQQSQLGKLLLGAGLAAAGIGLPAAAYIATQAHQQTPTPVEQPANNTTINQGLDEDTTIQLTLPEWSE